MNLPTHKLIQLQTQRHGAKIVFEKHKISVA